MRKSTNKELVTELTLRNVSGKYDKIIAEAQAGEYHDYKNTKYVCGKVELVKKLSVFPELEDIKNQVSEGEYDEVADEEDKEIIYGNTRLLQMYF